MAPIPVPRTSPENPVIRKPPPNEKLRAWMWCVGVVSAFASAVTTVLIVGAIAILNLGTTLGLIITVVLFCLVVGTGLWYANGKARL
jgi:hypothetical protein